jgi:outer membrane murein-binding lipoprotein Lpp
MDIEAELLQLKRRVDDLEGAINVLVGQVRAVHPELLAFKTEAARRFDAADGQMNRVLQRLDTLNSQVWSLRDDLPSLLRQALASPGEC